uniref:Putative choline kinase 3 n=1 Tax=Rhizophora mucronata TaxID=61149 RepID=A0A2P2NRH9_RHIMU
MTFDYHCDTPHIPDYSRYPDLQERRRFVHAYLCSAGNQTSEDEIERLLHDVEMYTLASHLLWGVWGLISGYVNKIDFDYVEYARQRLQQYWLNKPKLLESADALPYSKGYSISM